MPYPLILHAPKNGMHLRNCPFLRHLNQKDKNQLSALRLKCAQQTSSWLSVMKSKIKKIKIIVAECDSQMLKPKDNKLMMTTSTTMEDNNKLEILKSKIENVTTAIEEEEITSSSDSSINSKSEEKKKKNTNSFLILFNKLIKPLLFSYAWIPLTIFFLIMSNFEFIAYQCVYNSQEKYESQIGIETLAKLDKIFTLGFFVPYELMTYVYHPLLDFFFAIPYLNHFVFPLFIYPVIICLIIPNFSSMKQLLTRLHHPRKKVKLTTRKLKVYLLSLGAISIFQMILCIISPTAPPWYRTNLIRQHMVNTIFSSSSNLAPSPLTYNVEARFENVDRIIGFSLFHNIYSNGKIKYGSFYSLHVGWSSVILFVEMFVLAGGWTFKKTKNSIMKRTLSVMDDVVPVVAVTNNNDEESCYYERNGLKEEELKDLENQSNQTDNNERQEEEKKKKTWTWSQIFMINYVIWISFAAVYSAHHYLIDCLVGTLLAWIITYVVSLIYKK